MSNYDFYFFPLLEVGGTVGLQLSGPVFTSSIHTLNYPNLSNYLTQLYVSQMVLDNQGFKVVMSVLKSHKCYGVLCNRHTHTRW